MRSALLLAAALFSICAASTYGRNKVQSGGLEWWVISTPRFDVYYPEGAEVAVDTLVAVAERELESLGSYFDYLPDHPIPIVLYVSPGSFRQTEIITEELPEAVGGFTEYFKGRVVVPFDGNWSQFVHVIDHELNHAFVYSMLYSSSLERIVSSRAPLWTVEGLAEYTSAGWDQASEAEFRDMVIGQVTVPIEQLSNRGDYLVYREGQAIYRFIEERYGEERLKQFVRNLAGREGLDGAMEAAFDMSVAQFDQRFQEWARENYWAQLADRESPADVATPLTRDGRLITQYGSVLSRDANMIAGLEQWHGGLAITVRSTVDGDVIRRCMRSGGIRDVGLSPAYRICAFSPGGDSLAVAWHDVASDRLSICTPEGDRSLPFAFDLIRDPAWSPGGDSIAFVALEGSQADVWCWGIGAGTLSRLSETPGGERDLSWGRDGLLASMETGSGWTASIFRTGAWHPLAGGEDLRYPMSTDSGLVYLDYDGAAQDLFIQRGDGSRGRLTSLYRSIDSPSWADSSDVMTFLSNDWNGSTMFLGYGLLSRDAWPDSEVQPAINARVPRETVAGAGPDSVSRHYRITPYSPVLSTDYVNALAAYDSYLGLAGYTQLAFSDPLAHSRLYVLGNFSGSVTDADAGVYYSWLPDRLDYGGAVYRQSTRYVFSFSDGHEEEVRDVDTGISTGFSWPFSPALRIDGGAGFRHLTRTGIWNSDADYSANVLSVGAGLVLDTALWDWVGPRVGSRMLVRCEVAPPIGDLATYTTVSADFRRYLWVSSQVSLALRLAGASSWGENSQRFFLGGAVPHRELLGETDEGMEDLLGFYGNYGDMLRGERYSSRTGRNYAAATAEIRIPFVRAVMLDAPIPITLSNVRGVIFADAGTAFDEPAEFVGASTEGGFRLEDIGLGIGIGFRVNLGIFLLREDTAWATDLAGIAEKPRHYVSLGAGF